MSTERKTMLWNMAFSATLREIQWYYYSERIIVRKTEAMTALLNKSIEDFKTHSDIELFMDDMIAAMGECDERRFSEIITSWIGLKQYHRDELHGFHPIVASSE